MAFMKPDASSHIVEILNTATEGVAHRDRRDCYSVMASAANMTYWWAHGDLKTYEAPYAANIPSVMATLSTIGVVQSSA
jgi:hypothetical protein